ncbi:hypothetical protein H0H93_004701, partial [Arthromyces matolae]
STMASSSNQNAFEKLEFDHTHPDFDPYNSHENFNKWTPFGEDKAVDQGLDNGPDFAPGENEDSTSNPVHEVPKTKPSFMARTFAGEKVNFGGLSNSDSLFGTQPVAPVVHRMFRTMPPPRSQYAPYFEGQDVQEFLDMMES